MNFKNAAEGVTELHRCPPHQRSDACFLRPGWLTVTHIQILQTHTHSMFAGRCCRLDPAVCSSDERETTTDGEQTDFKQSHTDEWAAQMSHRIFGWKLVIVSFTVTHMSCSRQQVSISSAFQGKSKIDTHTFCLVFVLSAIDFNLNYCVSHFIVRCMFQSRSLDFNDLASDMINSF